MLPRIAFCTTCKGRVAHLEKTLPKNLADNADYENAVFIVLDYNSPDHLLSYLKEKQSAAIESGRLAVYSYREPVPFQVAHAKNMAHRLGILEGAEILINLDADNFTGPGFAEFIAEQFNTNEDIFLWSRMIQQGPDKLPRGINGRIGVSVKGFLHAGGYDERFAVWSPDDKDFNLRLRRLGYQPREIDRRFLNCLTHNDKMRFKHISTHENCEDIRDEQVDSCDTTVVNYGKIGCGTVYRLADTQPGKTDAENEPSEYMWLNQEVFNRHSQRASQAKIKLQPLPTRIFGIGMHKTATTSLHQALKILGFDSAHWKSAHWAKAIWDEMKAWGRSLTLERHYALCDLPIPILFRELDAAYPGSKFILTVRNERSWIQSVQNHWSHEHNPFRAAWSHDPFSHKIHKEIYGQKGFDAEIFLARYRKHNAEVLEYFKDRPADLLVMDMDKYPGWSPLGGYQDPAWLPLCQFLNKPVPMVEYPKAFVTRKPLADPAGEGPGNGGAL